MEELNRGHSSCVHQLLDLDLDDRMVIMPGNQLTKHLPETMHVTAKLFIAKSAWKPSWLEVFQVSRLLNLYHAMELMRPAIRRSFAATATTSTKAKF